MQPDIMLTSKGGASACTADPPAYDEAFEATGLLRPAYRSLCQSSTWDPLRPPPSVAEKLRDRPLGDDTRILPIPWVIDSTEYESVIRPGVAQRARALQSFFADVILGSGRIFSCGSLTQGLFDEILASEGRSLGLLRRQWASHEPEEIRFVYGPDLVRGPRGRWAVLEDNVGCIGGSADCYFVSEAYAQATGLSRTPSDPRESDLGIAVRRWIRRLGRAGDEDKIIALMGCESNGADPWSPQLRENVRRHVIMESLGIRAPTGDQLEQLWRDEHPGPRPRALVNFDVDDGAAHGPLHEVAFGRWRLPMLNTPGTGLLGNKALLPYVDDLIRFYCAEEPLLDTPTTQILRDGVLPGTASRWVVKLVAGSQGTGVFILSMQSDDQRAALRTLVQRSWPHAGAVIQTYVEPSRISPAGAATWDGYRLELRPIGYVLGWHDIYVGDQAVGKAISNFDLRRLNNISRGRATSRFFGWDALCPRKMWCRQWTWYNAGAA